MTSELPDKHEFLFYFHLMPADDATVLDLAAATGRTHDLPTVAIPAEVFFYIADTLQWIPCRRGRFSHFPLEHPVIAREGLLKAKEVFAAWKTLFSAADDEITLSFPDRKETFRREYLVTRFTQLEEFARLAAENNKVIYCCDAPDYRRHMNDHVTGTHPSDAENSENAAPISRKAS